MQKRISCLLIFMLSIWIGAAQETTAPAPAKKIGIEEYAKLLGQTNTVALDVRTPAEFEKGRIPGSINLDINSSRFAEELAKLDTNKTYLVNCAVGMRSARACKKMASMGFKHLYDLEPGFDGWKKAGQPVEK